jgi:hypothetical protein
VSLLLLFNPPKVFVGASASVASQSGVTATLYTSSHRAQAVVPGASSPAFSLESRASDQAAAAIAAISSISGTLTNATDKAAEVITVVSDVQATLRNQTQRASIAIGAVSSFSAAPYIPPAVIAAALIPAIAEVGFIIPPRSLSGVASASGGRSSSGSASGSSRGVAGTATSASGR